MSDIAYEIIRVPNIAQTQKFEYAKSPDIQIPILLQSTNLNVPKGQNSCIVQSPNVKIISNYTWPYDDRKGTPMVSKPAVRDPRVEKPIGQRGHAC